MAPGQPMTIVSGMPQMSTREQDSWAVEMTAWRIPPENAAASRGSHTTVDNSSFTRSYPPPNSRSGSTHRS